MRKRATNVTTAPDLDAILDRPGCAQWLGVSVDWLRNDAMQDDPVIPVFRLGHATVKYHPRTIIVTLQNRAKIPPALITAGFGTQAPTPLPAIVT